MHTFAVERNSFLKACVVDLSSIVSLSVVRRTSGKVFHGKLAGKNLCPSGAINVQNFL